MPLSSIWLLLWVVAILAVICLSIVDSATSLEGVLPVCRFYPGRPAPIGATAVCPAIAGHTSAVVIHHVLRMWGRGVVRTRGHVAIGVTPASPVGVAVRHTGVEPRICWRHVSVAVDPGVCTAQLLVGKRPPRAGTVSQGT